MTPSAFIAASPIVWHHDQGCNDDKASSNPSGSQLASGAWSRRAANGSACTPYDNYFATNDYSSVNETYASPRPEAGEGWFLNLPNGQRDGNGFAGDEDVIVRQDLDDHWIQYWYNFGDSANRWGTGHEGDWEHIAYRLNGANTKPVEVEYSYHHYKCTLLWDDVPTNGSDDRPIVWIAQGSHGSYPKGGSTVGDTGHHSDALKDKIDAGPFWNAQDNLKSLSSHDWHGYKGSWGDRWSELDLFRDFEDRDYGPSSPGGWRAAPAFDDPKCTF